ncbi:MULTISPECIES: NDP-sugar synthase [unclassified Polaribacter]|uniref:nucleotidyltransferase family protein n=1 Tax=unclassified Polaribacter TaxID=196858 RepID=UPI0011BDDAA6|nr:MULTISPECIES: sugar phosphate nucleotidyltransferase [unclassified Polaribacter]TXD53535.1 nucleotide-diphospho-sugar transferase [Polaribacter sp. IC063]TXD58607.1 nucleotide-diphospho-sugar transferase [Polaribacter sp. IC066]
MNKTNKPTLVVLAAGMGSRYGGLKQMDTFTPEGDTIIDFSLYDAIQAGFGKVVFIIRKSFEEEFKTLFNKKLAGKIEIAYVFQELDTVPEKYIDPERVKPWGTGHALLMTKEVVKENFAIINADDFYSRQAFDAIAEQLRNTDSNSYNFSMVAYSLKNTISENGYVSRGECSVDENNFLTDVTERVRIEKIDGVLKSETENGNMIPIDENCTVSMNFWGFTPKCFEFGNELFLTFLEESKGKLKAEFYLPTIVNKMLDSEKVSVKVLQSNSKWFGVTYSEDKETAQNEINTLKENGVYPTKLWN